MARGEDKLSELHPEVVRRALLAARVAERFGVPVTFTSGFRTLDEQAALRARFEAGQSRFPANRPGDSAHNWGLAFDSVVPEEAQTFWTLVRRLVGFSVPVNDPVHAEVPQWRTLVTAP